MLAERLLRTVYESLLTKMFCRGIFIVRYVQLSRYERMILVWIIIVSLHFSFDGSKIFVRFDQYLRHGWLHIVRTCVSVRRLCYVLPNNKLYLSFDR